MRKSAQKCEKVSNRICPLVTLKFANQQNHTRMQSCACTSLFTANSFLQNIPSFGPLFGDEQIWGNPKYQPFGVSPLFYNAHPRLFQPPKCILTPSKCKLGRGGFCVARYKKLQIGGRQSLFGGCRFTFWRLPIYILEAEIVLGVLHRKGGKPQKVGTRSNEKRPLRLDRSS